MFTAEQARKNVEEYKRILPEMLKEKTKIGMEYIFDKIRRTSNIGENQVDIWYTSLYNGKYIDLEKNINFYTKKLKELGFKVPWWAFGALYFRVKW